MDFYVASIIIVFLTLIVPMFLPLLIKSWKVITAVVFLDMLVVVTVIRHIDPTTMKF